MTEVDYKLLEAKIELENLQRRHEQFLKENGSYVENAVEFQDTNIMFNDLEKYRQRELGSDDFNFDDNEGEDQILSSPESKFGITDDFNNSVGVMSESLSPDVGCVLELLDDLDTCLEKSINTDGSECKSKSDVDIGSSCNELFTPPSRVNTACQSFSKLVDSVVVNKKRLSEIHIHNEDNSEDNKAESATGCASSNIPHYKAIASKSLAYDKCEFVNFAKISDGTGHVHFVPKKVNSQDSCPPHFVKGTPKNRFSNSYLASLNKSGNLSPFMRSIVERYSIFDKNKGYFKPLILDLPEPTKQEDDSCRSFMLGHHAEVKMEAATGSIDDEITDAVPSTSQDRAGVDRMLNDYVYEVLTGQSKAPPEEHSLELTASDIEVRFRAPHDIDSSMNVCFDDDSVAVSKDEMSDHSVEISDNDSWSFLISLYDDSHSMPPDDCAEIVPVSTAQPDNEQTNVLPSDIYSDPHAVAMTSHLITMFERENETLVGSAKKDENTQRNQVSKSTHHYIPRNDRLTRCLDICWNDGHNLLTPSSSKKHSRFCTIPFTSYSSNDSPSWVCRDFEMSPVTIPRIRSPKRSLSELKSITEKDKLQNVLETCNLSPGAGGEHWSPAKKRRKCDKPEMGLNVNTNACVQTPLHEALRGSEVSLHFEAQEHKDVYKDEPNEGSHNCCHEICSHSCTKQDTDEISSQIQKCTSADVSISSVEVSVSNADVSVSIADVSIAKVDVSMSNADISIAKSQTENSPNIVKACSQKRKKRGFWRKTRSPIEKEFDSPVRLLGYKKLQDTQPSPSCESERNYKADELAYQSPKSSLRNNSRCKLRPESLQRFMVDSPYKASETSSMFMGEVESYDDRRVDTFFGCDEAKSEDKHKPSPGSNSDDSIDHNINQLKNGTRHTQYDTEQMEDPSSQVSVKKVNEDSPISVETSRDDLCESTPDAELLIRDLQGLDLSETPKYANVETVDREMNAVLSEALDSLDGIMSETFSFSVESPIKSDHSVEVAATSEREKESCSDSLQKTDDSDLLDLVVVGKKCALYDATVDLEKTVNDEEVIKPTMSDTSIEVVNDSILYVDGESSILYDPEMLASTYLPTISITDMDFNLPDFDEVHELENDGSSQATTSQDEIATTDTEGLETRLLECIRKYEKQPTYFCMNSCLLDDETANEEIGEINEENEEIENVLFESNNGLHRVSTMIDQVPVDETPRCAEYLNLSGMSDEDLCCSRLSETDIRNDVERLLDFTLDYSIDESLRPFLDGMNVNKEQLDDVEIDDAKLIDGCSLNETRGSSLDVDFSEFEKQDFTAE